MGFLNIDVRYEKSNLSHYIKKILIILFWICTYYNTKILFPSMWLMRVFNLNSGCTIIQTPGLISLPNLFDLEILLLPHYTSHHMTKQHPNLNLNLLTVTSVCLSVLRVEALLTGEDSVDSRQTDALFLPNVFKETSWGERKRLTNSGKGWQA